MIDIRLIIATPNSNVMFRCVRSRSDFIHKIRSKWKSFKDCLNPKKLFEIELNHFLDHYVWNASLIQSYFGIWTFLLLMASPPWSRARLKHLTFLSISRLWPTFFFIDFMTLFCLFTHHKNTNGDLKRICYR